MSEINPKTGQPDQEHQSGLDIAPDALLLRARQRAADAGEPFAGLLYPQEAWALFKAGAALLVDVRTDEELKHIGRVPEAAHVVWKSGPDMVLNPHFVQQVEAIAPKDKTLLLLCRGGLRSASAAHVLTEAGYANAFNILEGFEGELDGEQRRGTFNGWRFRGLPWLQD